MADSPSWSLSFDADNIGWLVCDSKDASTNVLSAAVLRDLAARLAEIRARFDAADSGITIPRFYLGDDAPILPDKPAPFVFVVFNIEGSGGRPAEVPTRSCPRNSF